MRTGPSRCSTLAAFKGPVAEDLTVTKHIEKQRERFPTSHSTSHLSPTGCRCRSKITDFQIHILAARNMAAFLLVDPLCT